MRAEPDRPSISTTRVVLAYCVFAGLWIFLSDYLVGLMVQDAQTLTALETAKGTVFVAVTGLLLYALVGRLTSGMRRESAAREEAVRRSHRRLLSLIEEAPVPLAMFDRELRYLAASERWKQDYELVGEAVLGRAHNEVFPDLPDRWKESYRKALAGETTRVEEDRFVRQHGGERWLRWEVRPWHAEDGAIGGIIIFNEDITDRKLTEKELRIAATAFESQQGIFITDRHARILRVNRVFQQTTGYPADEVVGKTPSILKSGRHGKEFYDQLWATLRATGTWRGEIWNRRRNGEVFAEDLSISAVLNDAGDVTNYVGTFTDISGSKLAEETIYNLSFYDPLTGLPNRRLLLERIKQEILSSLRRTSYAALFKLDLDRFSMLNDTRSRHAGDHALAEIGRRIVACVPPGDTAARLANDEFAVLACNLGPDHQSAARQARSLAEAIMAAIRQPIEIEDGTYVCTACVGIRVFVGGETSADDLLRQVNVALQQAQRLGRDSYHFFDVNLQAALEHRASLESLLRAAGPGEFILHYQPQVDLSGRVSGAEALVRWRHPSRGIVPPGDFIPLAEETGVILQMGRWILQAACRQLRDWDADQTTRHLSVAVNVSAKQLAHPGFVDEVVTVLAASGADPRKLELELTESMLVGDANDVTEKMAALKAHGIHFALDDFGTGFSSLAYLRRMPIDKLKIDQSFIADVHRNASDAAIARTIIALGQSLGLAVIAEGVELEEQMSFLAVHGCMAYQGFLFGRPVAPEELTASMRSEGATVH